MTVTSGHSIVTKRLTHVRCHFEKDHTLLCACSCDVASVKTLTGSSIYLEDLRCKCIQPMYIVYVVYLFLSV